MSQYKEGRRVTAPASGAIGQYLRVKYDGSFNLVVATATDVELGTIDRPALALAQPMDVITRNAQGTQIMVANGAITKGADVFAAAAGKVSATGVIKRGTALEATTADGDYLEVLPLAASAPASVAAVAAAGTVQGDAAALTGVINVVSAADGTKGVVLPTPVAGMRLVVKNNVNAVLKVWPAVGGTINAIAINTNMAQAALTCAEYIATSSTQWFTLPLLPS